MSAWTESDPGVRWLLSSEEPAIRYRTLTDVLGRDESDGDVKSARAAIMRGPKVARILEAHEPDRRTLQLLFLLAEWRVPGDDPRVRAGMDHVLDALATRRGDRTAVAGGHKQWPIGRGEGTALYLCSRFGLAGDARAAALVRVLHSAQWPEGGWHFKPHAPSASFDESSMPMRGLFAYHQATGDRLALEVATRAYDLFLGRGFLRSERTGNVIAGEWLKLHWPRGFDVLFALEALRPGGLDDSRLTEAFDLIEGRRTKDGLWRASPAKGVAVVDLSDGTSDQMVTLRALTILRAAGRVPGKPRRGRVGLLRSRGETLRTLLDDAGLDTEVRSIEPIDGHHLGTHARVRLGDGESYLFREYRTHKSVADLYRQREERVYRSLRDAGLPLPEVLATIEGSWGAGGDASAMLLHDVSGTSLEALARGSPRPAMWSEVATMLRALHDVPAASVLPPSATTWGNQFVTFFSQSLRRAKTARPDVARAVDEILKIRPAVQSYLDAAAGDPLLDVG